MFSNTTGNPVQGEDFFDREREQSLIWERLIVMGLLTTGVSWAMP